MYVGVATFSALKGFSHDMPRGRSISLLAKHDHAVDEIAVIACSEGCVR